MCHDADSRPPAPPRSGDVAERGTLTLTSADGTEVAAAYAAPAGETRVGVVLLPDIRGLHPYYVALAERFAEAGSPALAVDWFGRTADLPEDGARGQDFDWRTHIPQVTAAGVDADVTAAVAYLRERTRRTCPWSPSASASAAATPGGWPGAPTWTSPAASASTASRS
ncbi:dienelactone hydrolase family protein [Geodermatophilus sp. URMC 60]